MKKFLRISLILISLFALERFCHWQTKGFSLQKITSNLPYNPQWEAVSPDLDKNLFGQPFHFLGSGGQCYAFVSSDGAYVLKVLKMHHMRPLPWLENLRLPSLLNSARQKFLKIRKNRLEHIFGSFALSMRELKEETGLLYLHLNKTTGLKTPLTLIDRIGIAHTIELDEIPFALQKRATLCYETLDALMQSEEVERAKQCVSSLMGLLVRCAQKELSDRDPIIRRNFGFIGTQAIEIDLGSFSKDPFAAKGYTIKRELFFKTRKFTKWLSRHHPELLAYFYAEREHLFNNLP